MKGSHFLILGLTVLGVYLTWKSIQVTQENTLAVIQNTKGVTGTIPSAGTQLGFDHIIYHPTQGQLVEGISDAPRPPVLPNLQAPISRSLLGISV